jgi:hypothetical protein
LAFRHTKQATTGHQIVYHAEPRRPISNIYLSLRFLVPNVGFPDACIELPLMYNIFDTMSEAEPNEEEQWETANRSDGYPSPTRPEVANPFLETTVGTKDHVDCNAKGLVGLFLFILHPSVFSLQPYD